ncbi:SAM-dependent DNA methylase [Desulfonema limicola]|uniref:Methyltransferase n=1 Tax=Desulfonema limicola TaxID=45656 RepID=A0A975BAZ0_9BACT|nr:site-specific DNA-methyltransferase [Desulfonema limicola]QTA81962.1 SAM-dependent DNA methylase [Desulfonema limicola]
MIEKFINKIMQGDCLELFKNIPDNSVDMTFADPPFNLKKNYTSYSDSLDFQEYLNWCEKWIYEMVRVTKPAGSIFLHNIPKWLTYYTACLNKIANFKHWISWDAPTSPMGKSLQPAHYGILFYTKEAGSSKIYELRYPHKRDRKQGFLLKDYGGKKDLLHPFGPLISDVWTDIHRIKHNKKRDPHPCQLPIHLMDRLILMTTDENDIVLDPFSGTGTTAISAKRLGRKYIGFELDKKYVEISKEKIEDTESNYKIGKSWVSFYLKDIITIRNNDWNDIKKYFIIPEPLRAVDYKKVKIKDSKLIPNKKRISCL